ncbi:MAG: gluconate 2-dehydrogenase subunit 3 family protein [Chloroflexota bacterium]
MLNQDQLKVLQTVVNIIITADDDPGGWEGGVGDYLLHQFEGDLKHMLAIYEQGLMALNAEVKTVTGKSLDELDPQAQEAFMAAIEQGQVQETWPVDPAPFFAMLVQHCAEGFYSDPGNYGNHDRAAWKMIGFEVTR